MTDETKLQTQLVRDVLNAVSTLDITVQKLGADVQNLSTNMNILQADIVTLKADMLVVQDEIHLMQETMGIIQKNMGIIQETMGIMQDEMQTLARKDDVQDVKNELHLLRDVVIDTNRELRTHDKRLTAVEASLLPLRAA